MVCVGHFCYDDVFCWVRMGTRESRSKIEEMGSWKECSFVKKGCCSLWLQVIVLNREKDDCETLLGGRS